MKQTIEYTYTYGYDVTKETYPQRIERAKKDKRIARMVIQLLATERLPKWTQIRASMAQKLLGITKSTTFNGTGGVMKDTVYGTYT